MRWMWLIVLAAVGMIGGCSVDRVVTISTHPSAATVRIDGVEKGSAPLVYRFTFNGNNDEHRIELSHPGYKDASIDITRTTGPQVTVELKQQSKHITINVQPFPGVISINGKPMTQGNAGTYSTDLDFAGWGEKLDHVQNQCPAARFSNSRADHHLDRSRSDIHVDAAADAQGNDDH